MTNRLGKGEVYYYCSQMMQELDEEFNLIEEFNISSSNTRKLLLVLLHETLCLKILSVTNCDSDQLVTDIMSYFEENLTDDRTFN